MTGWTLVIPVKSLSGAKTRLAPELAPAERAALARAFALDAVDAARGARSVARVVVVSDEPAIELALRDASGVDVVPEAGPRGLAAAIAHGIAVARADSAPERAARADAAIAADAAVRADAVETSRTAGGTDHPGLLGAPESAGGADAAVAVLLGDLPALRAGDLDAALEVAARHPLAFVPDADGTGTTLATARGGEPLTAHFGADSAARHAAAGFADLVAAEPGAIAPGLRRDVDTAAELREALSLGIGPRTTAVVATLTDLVAASAPRHPLDPSTAPLGADRKAAS